MRFRGMSITMLGAATLLLALSAPDAEAQRRRLGTLRPTPRPQVGLSAGRPRWGAISPHFFNTCFIVPSLGAVPFVNIQIFAGGQPAPDPSSHLAPDPSRHLAPDPSMHAVPLPGSHPVPGVRPAPRSAAANPRAVPVFAPPVYSAPVYSVPVHRAASPVATPRVRGGMVVGDVIVDPTFGWWGSPFFFGGGVTCIPTRFLGSTIIIR